MTIPPIDIVLTCGMHSHLAKVFQTPISQNLSAELGRLVDEFCSQLARILPRNTRLTCYNATDLTKELWHSSRHWGEPFVSLDDTHIRWADAYYRITNLVSWNGEAEWIAKPGSLSVDTQLSALANFRTVILCDIGAQSCQKALKSIQDLKKAGVNVSRIL